MNKGMIAEYKGWQTADVMLYVVLWGMPTDPCPATTCFDDDRVIHIEGDYSSGEGTRCPRHFNNM